MLGDVNEFDLQPSQHEALRNAVMDRHEVEHAYPLGDALRFSRHVLHRSAPFHDGPQQRRRAFVMRVIPGGASSNPALLRDATALFTKFGMHSHEDPGELRRHDLQPGDPLERSRLLPRLF